MKKALLCASALLVAASAQLPEELSYEEWRTHFPGHDELGMAQRHI